MNRTLAFLLLVGFASASDLRHSLQQQLTEAKVELERTSMAFTATGLDYMAEKIQELLQRVAQAQKNVEHVSNDPLEAGAKFMIHEVKVIVMLKDSYTKNPAPEETYKGQSLYLAVIKTLINDTSEPTPEVLKKQVADIVNLETQFRALKPDDLTGRQELEKKVNLAYANMMTGQGKQELISPANLIQVIVDAEKKINRLEDQNKQEESLFLKAALDKFKEANYRAGKIYPIDSRTRITQFLAISKIHFQDYKILNALVHGETKIGA